jgi:acyl-coenzyme A thioesterase PaaI-like protein
MFVTGNLNVSYLHPTPANTELVLRAHIKKQLKRKTVVTCSLSANNKECAQGETIAVRIR